MTGTSVMSGRNLSVGSRAGTGQRKMKCERSYGRRCGRVELDAGGGQSFHPLMICLCPKAIGLLKMRGGNSDEELTSTTMMPPGVFGDVRVGTRFEGWDRARLIEHAQVLAQQLAIEDKSEKEEDAA